MILLKAYQDNRFIVLKFFTQQNYNKEFRMIRKKYFLLNTSCPQWSSPNVFIRKINFTWTDSLLNWTSIFFDLELIHGFNSVINEDLLKAPCFDFSLQNKLCSVFWWIGEVSEQILDNAAGFVLWMGKDMFEVVISIVERLWPWVILRRDQVEARTLRKTST